MLGQMEVGLVEVCCVDEADFPDVTTNGRFETFVQDALSQLIT